MTGPGSQIEPHDGRQVVVVVDDDHLVTASLEAYLSQETQYEVHAFLSPAEALQRMQTVRPDVIIADFLMPEMDGLQFLASAKELYPDVTAILLTGYADKENAIKAINEVGIFQYVEKPWDNENLKLMIRNGIAQKTLRAVLREKIQELDTVLLEKDQLAQDTQMLREELRLAQNVQQSMLPQMLPSLDGFVFEARYEPALEVGGDFYDVIELAEGRRGLLIADVTGHGIQAALMTVLLKSTFAGFRGSTAQPREILRHMNRVLKQVLPKGHFVAGMVAVLDPKKAVCTLANGGIPHPYHLRRAERRVERVPANGLLLGVAPEDAFEPGEERRVTLAKGDRLLFLTDGITEAENDRQEHFEGNGLMAVLEASFSGSPADLIEALTGAARAFAHPGHKWDDMATVILERR